MNACCFLAPHTPLVPIPSSWLRRYKKTGQQQETQNAPAAACPVSKEAEPPPNEPPACPAPFKQDSLVVSYTVAAAPEGPP
jgi:hypothetical protein